ncbi:hypothetical protein BH10BAC5_BH10BAC5_10410 [soil metagenome]
MNNYFRNISNNFIRILVLIIIFIPCTINSQTATAVVNLSTLKMTNTKLLFGISLDARTGMVGNSGPIGYFTSGGSLVSGMDTIFNDFPFSTVRYSVNGIMVGFNWKNSIGVPASNRPPQNLLGALGQVQPVLFGFDEFMAMTVSYNIDPKDVQIMVPIYDSSWVGLNSIQYRQAFYNIATFVADWVEYANAVNDGSNPGGGTDWAALRSLNGHNEPYGIKIWNMGNEPWAPTEYTNSTAGCNTYLSTITPIIDSMLVRDSTIKITLATVGVVTSNWNSTIFNSSLVAAGKIYGISPHYFPREPSNGITNVENNLNGVTVAAANKNLKVFVGDYAPNIVSNPTQVQMDSAMQWGGAVTTTDMMLMLSQKSNIERMNFWVFGVPTSVYHPIRFNGTGNYTEMPVASLYKKLYPLVLDNSLLVNSNSLPGSDGYPYSVRSAGFISSDSSLFNLISVNRDKSLTNTLSIIGINGFGLVSSKLLTSTGLDAEIINESDISSDVNGFYSMPPLSVLILQYAEVPLPVELNNFSFLLKDNNDVILKWSTGSEINNLGFNVQRRSETDNNWSDLGFIPGIGNSNIETHYSYKDTKLRSDEYYYRLKQIDNNGNYKFYNLSGSVNVAKPLKFELFQNYPNPFNPSTTISFDIPETGLYSLNVYNIAGQLISTIKSKTFDEGSYKVLFNSKSLSSGLYFYILSGNKYKSIKKMIIVK